MRTEKTDHAVFRQGLKCASDSIIQSTAGGVKEDRRQRTGERVRKPTSPA